MTNCSFIVNTAGVGGGIDTFMGNPTVTNSGFCGNTPNNDQIHGDFNDGGGNSMEYCWDPDIAKPDPCLGDLDGNGVVNTADLLILFANWGPCK